MEEKTEDRHDPGWNDPPLFTYDKATAIQSSATRKGTLLNKRVAYPMTGKAMSDAINKPVTNPIMSTSPPISSQMSAPPIGSCAATQVSNSKSEENASEKLSKSDRLDKVLKNLDVLVPVSDDGEISKRIKIMKNMWMDDKLDEHVQLKLIELTDALCRDDVELAGHLQIGLMVDYVSQCSSWMSGIRQIITYKRQAKRV